MFSTSHPGGIGSCASRGAPVSATRVFAQQPPVGNEPLTDTRGGVLDALRRRLRPVDNGTGNLFGSRMLQDAEGPRGVKPPDRQALRVPLPEAVPAARILRRRKRALAAVGGSTPPRVGGASPPDASAVFRSEALGRVRRAFADAASAAAVTAASAATGARDRMRCVGCVEAVGAGLESRLFDLAVPGLRPYENPVLLGSVLARLSKGDPVVACAILDSLATAEPRDAAFAAQRALAACGGPGIECLMRLAPAAAAASDLDPLSDAIRREAFACRLRIAGRLCDSLPARVPQPRSLAECVGLAKALAATDLLAGRELPVHGLLCAQALVDNPAADVPAAWRGAYLAVRNGLFDAAALQAAQERLFKLNTYIARASERGGQRFGSAAQRLFGYRKSPLHALAQMGTAQSKTRHPCDDVANRCAAMDTFIDRVDAQLAAWPARRPPDQAALRKSIRIALVRHWKAHIVHQGWQDSLPVGTALRRAVAADVARQLGCPADAVRRHPLLRAAGPLAAPLLARWAHEEALDFDQPAAPAPGGAARTFGEAISAFLQMQQGGDRLLRRPSHAQTRELLHHAIRDTRQTYSVTFGGSGTLGLQASVVDILAFTPVPVGVGPTAGATASRGAYVQVGSNVHGGQIHAGSQRAGHLEAGVSGFVGKKLGDVLNLGLTANLTPLAIDHTRSHATVLRTRMDTIGAAGDGDAWRTLLLDACDCITRQDGGAGAPRDAAQMWSQLARRHFRNPNLSICDLHSKLTTLAGSASATLGARAGVVAGMQVGPALTAGLGKTWQSRLRQRERGDNRSTELHADSGGHGVTASAGLTGLAPGITGGAIHDNLGHPGTTQSLTLSSANLGSQGVSLLRGGSGVTLRIVTDQGRVDADYSVMDTETGSARSFARYVDSQRADWLAAIGGDDPAGELDTFLTRLETEQTRGNVTYGERRRMTPAAARQTDYLRALAAAAGPGAEAARLQGEVSLVLADPLSWDPRSLWVLDLNQQVSTKGLAVIVQLASRKQVGAPRQRNVLVARHAPRRVRADEVEF